MSPHLTRTGLATAACSVVFMMAGVVTEFVIDSSCWNAVDLGYNVIIVDDGCCSADVETHKNCVAAMAARADITTVDEVVGLLAD